MSCLGPRVSLLAATVLTLSSWSCVEWLEVDPPVDAPPYEAEEPALLDHTSSLPDYAARVDAAGPIVPRTPGLRVPKGYWSHGRLDTMDVWLPYTWAAVQVYDGVRSDRPSGLTLRMLATVPLDSPTESPSQFFRAVVPVTMPAGATLRDLVGLKLDAPSLSGAQISLRTGKEHLWLIEPIRLTIDEVSPQAIKGTLEGIARRGSKSRRERQFRLGFVAFLAPPDAG